MGVIRERQFVLIFCRSTSTKRVGRCLRTLCIIVEKLPIWYRKLENSKWHFLMRKNSCYYEMDSYSLCYVIYHIQCEGKLREWNLTSLHFTHDSSNKVFPFHGKNSMMNLKCVLLRIFSLDVIACQHMFELLKIRDNSIYIGFYKAYVIFFLP